MLFHGVNLDIEYYLEDELLNSEDKYDDGYNFTNKVIKALEVF